MFFLFLFYNKNYELLSGKCSRSKDKLNKHHKETQERSRQFVLYVKRRKNNWATASSSSF